ncbi:MAG TPA: His-Xaa-Ser system radical SAM maturase HxsB [Methylomirabilota bacterium]|nr:His-Xaa-Ser system radical SAM maturase HxsB [Methylomirabilota bacterium]
MSRDSAKQTARFTFHPLESYRRKSTQYTLLPFRFMRFGASRFVLVNEVGEFIFLDEGTFRAFATRALRAEHPAYLDLKAKHFLADDTSSPLLDVLATKYRTKKSFLRGFTKLHLFVVTLRCDHSCHYCQVSRQSEDRAAFDMKPSTARKAVDLMLKTPAEAITMEFQGGEPLLNFQLIKFMVEYSEARNQDLGKQIDRVITTNLSKATPDILEYCRDHGIGLSTSLDGPEWLHNANRPRPGNDSYARAIENIALVRSIVGPGSVDALMTTTRRSLPHVRDIIDEYVARGFRSIFLRSISPYGFAVKTRGKTGYLTDEFLRFYREGLSYILELNRRGIEMTEIYAKILLTKILTPFPTSFTDLQSPAGLGIGAVVYNYDGDVYASDEARMLAEMKDRTFRLGNVHDDTYDAIFRSPKLRSIIAASVNESLPGCSDCAYQLYCGGDPVFHHATQGDMMGHRPTSEFCRKNMAIINELLRYIESGDKDVMRIFWGWVYNRRLAEDASCLVK